MQLGASESLRLNDHCTMAAEEDLEAEHALAWPRVLHKDGLTRMAENRQVWLKTDMVSTLAEAG